MFKLPDAFEVKPLPAWSVTPAKPIIAPKIDNEEEKKKAFGIELAKGVPAFQAACNICGQSTQQALWISSNWLNDPIVIANKDIYLKGVKSAETLLDSDQLAARLLAMAEERNSSGTFYILDGKDRLSALALYAKIRGYTDKDKDIQNNNNFVNQLIVKFVEPDKKEIREEIIDVAPVDSSVPKLKLVG